jgi:hypothetical protein
MRRRVAELPLLLLLLLLSTAALPSRAAQHVPLTRDEYARLLATGGRPPVVPSPPPPAHAPPPSPRDPAPPRPPIVLIPDLDAPGARPPPRGPPPLPALGASLARASSVAAADYARAECAPPPVSRIAHCVPVPAPGPLTALAHALAAEYGYVVGDSIAAVPYDHRPPPHRLAHPQAAFARALRRVIAELAPADAVPTLIVAHGYGCIVASLFLAAAEPAWRERHVGRLWCIAAPLRGSTAAAMQFISGHVVRVPGHGPAGGLASWANARVPGRIDARAMEFTLGLQARPRRRSLLPRVAGVWDLIGGGTRLHRPGPAVEALRGLGSLAALLPSGCAAGNESLRFPVSHGGARHPFGRDGMRAMADAMLGSPAAGERVYAAMSWADDGGAPPAPHVPVTCVYGSGIDTPGTLSYASGRPAGDEPPAIDWVSGDGSVAVHSASFCSAWEPLQAQAVEVHDVPLTRHDDLQALTATLRSHLDSCGLRRPAARSAR